MVISWLCLEVLWFSELFRENSGLRSFDSDSAAMCQVMRVVVFDRYGTVLHKFGCSRHLEFPNGVVANDQDEIFISDNRSHCVKVTTQFTLTQCC